MSRPFVRRTTPLLRVTVNSVRPHQHFERGFELDRLRCDFTVRHVPFFDERRLNAFFSCLAMSDRVRIDRFERHSLTDDPFDDEEFKFFFVTTLIGAHTWSAAQEIVRCYRENAREFEVGADLEIVDYEYSGQCIKIKYNEC